MRYGKALAGRVYGGKAVEEQALGNSRSPERGDASQGSELESLLVDLYLKFKLRYYQKVLKRFQDR